MERGANPQADDQKGHIPEHQYAYLYLAVLCCLWQLLSSCRADVQILASFEIHNGWNVEVASVAQYPIAAAVAVRRGEQGRTRGQGRAQASLGCRVQSFVLTEGGAAVQPSIRGFGLRTIASFDLHNGSVDLRK